MPTDDQNTQMPGAPMTDPTAATPADMTAPVPGQAINDQMAAGQAPVSNDQPMMSGASTTPAAPMATEPVAQTPPAPTETTPMGTTPTPMDMGAGSMQTPSTGAMPTDGTGDQAA